MAVTKAESDRRWRAKHGAEWNSKRKAERHAYRAKNPIIPKPLIAKIQKTCIQCGASFEVFPCLDRILCCSKTCAAKVRGEKLKGPWLPAVRACKCGKVEELNRRSQCIECNKDRARKSYHRNNHKWTEDQKELRRRCSNRAKTKLRSTPEGRKAHNLRLRELDSRRRAQMKSTRVGRVSYKSLLEEFGMVCNICTCNISDGELSFDHVIPLARGGSHTQDNIRPAHLSCNKKKNSRLPEEFACLFKA